jgi:hypothetical protein
MDGSNLTYDGTELVTRGAIAADGIAHLVSIYLLMTAIKLSNCDDRVASFLGSR